MLRSSEIFVDETSVLAKIFSLLNQQKTAISFDFFKEKYLMEKKVGCPSTVEKLHKILSWSEWK